VRPLSAGLCLLGPILLLCALAELIAPRSPLEVDLQSANLAPLSLHREAGGRLERYWLGTDSLGRDVLSRLLRGGRTSLLVAGAAQSLALIFGLLLGTAAGYWGGPAAALVEGLLQILGAFPYVLLALAIRSQLGASKVSLVLALAAAGWLTTARVVRGHVRLLRVSGPAEAARAAGAADRQVLRRHVGPALSAPLSVLGSWGLARALLAESALSYLGIGVVPPQPSWGHMLRADLVPLLYGGGAWWAAVFPGLALVITILGFQLLGDALTAEKFFSNQKPGSRVL
jgi:peptide/nickel transport system permease protein